MLPNETDAEFLARMEAEEASAFAAAVAEWRTERQAGRGEAKVVEAGGAFAAVLSTCHRSGAVLRTSDCIGKPVIIMDDWLRLHARGASDSYSVLDALRAADPGGGIKLESERALTAFLAAAKELRGRVASSLVLIIDYDLTLSAAATAECHHMLRDASSMPEGFRADVHTLFDARSPEHAQHRAIYGAETDAERPHRFWMHYNQLLVEHGVTLAMIEGAVAEEGRRREGKLLREGVGELLALCEAAGALVVILSAGLEQVVRGAFAHDGVPLPASCRLLTNRLVFDEGGGGGCVAVEPRDPPASREGKLTMLAGLAEAAERSLVLMVGDKPVDARVAKGLRPRADRPAPRVELAFGYFNGDSADSVVPAVRSEWQAAFHLLAHRGAACSFEPVTELVRRLLASDAG